MEHDIKGVLGIQGWVVYGTREEAGRLVVRVGQLRRGARCPQCGAPSRRVHQRMGWRHVWHMAVAGTPVYLELRPRRYWCRPCGRAFTEPYRDIRKWGRRSRLGEALLLRELSGQSFGTVTRKTGVGYRALRGVVARADVGIPWAELLRQAGDEGL
jgi:transposase